MSTVHGTLIDFLQLAAEKEALRAELVALAAKHDFTFVPDGLSDEDLDAVSGGVVMDNGSALTAGIVMDDGAAKTLDSPLISTKLGMLGDVSKLLGFESTKLVKQ